MQAECSELHPVESKSSTHAAAHYGSACTATVCVHMFNNACSCGATGYTYSVPNSQTVHASVSTCPGKAEEQCHIILRAYVTTCVQGQDVAAWHHVVHHTEDALLHLSRIFSP